jgi:phage tail sheath gpL-like
VRPKTAKSYAIQLVDRWAGLGLTKNRDDVVDGIVAEINSTNAGRIDVMIPDDFALGLRIMAALLEWDS